MNALPWTVNRMGHRCARYARTTPWLAWASCCLSVWPLLLLLCPFSCFSAPSPTVLPGPWPPVPRHYWSVCAGTCPASRELSQSGRKGRGRVRMAMVKADEPGRVGAWYAITMTTWLSFTNYILYPFTRDPVQAAAPSSSCEATQLPTFSIHLHHALVRDPGIRSKDPFSLLPCGNVSLVPNPALGLAVLIRRNAYISAPSHALIAVLQVLRVLSSPSVCLAVR